MTPSHSSAPNSLSRTNPSSLAHRRHSSSSLFRRLFEQTPKPTARFERGVDEGDAQSESRLNGNNHRHVAANNGVTEFLHGAVAELLHEQHGTKNGSEGPNGAGAASPLIDRRSSDPVIASTKTVSALRHIDQAAPQRNPTWKRVLDLILILATSPAWLPLMLLLMLAVRLSSPGPVFYRQERVGFRRRPFMIYKFRSMKVDAETEVHEAHFARLMSESVPMKKLDGAGDPRILPWG